VNVQQILAESAVTRGSRPAVTFEDSTLTYAELWRQVIVVATGLRGLGLRRGDRVAVYADKRIETVLVLFGAAAAGGVFVPVNPLLRPRQVGHILSDCAARVLVTTASRIDLLRVELARCPSLEYVVLINSETGASQAAPTELGWEELLRAGANDAAASVDGAAQSGIDIDPAALFYTSGSTGRPKGVLVSHRNLLVGAESVNRYLLNTADDVLLAVLPLSFDAGFSQLTTGLSAGAHIVLTNYLFPSDVVRLCVEHRVTGLTCVPPLWIQLSNQVWPATATSVMRYFANTGGRMPKTALDRLRSIFPNATPFLMYGLTEAFRSTYLDPAEIDRRPHSIGKAIPNAEILVLRPDGSSCEPGEEGELVHRGGTVALGYWNDAQRTSERFRPLADLSGRSIQDVAVWSGDIAFRDDDGFLYFVGRRDEMIKTSGYRVSPEEVEEAAHETGLIRAAVAIGVADEQLGQHVVLVVCPAAGQDLQPETLISELRRRLPRYMVPKAVIVRSELPRSPNGKLDRARLRTELGG
jgi:acyl-CoA ligase (AMP-forming) (exosortase A-associated)